MATGGRQMKGRSSVAIDDVRLSIFVVRTENNTGCFQKPVYLFQLFEEMSPAETDRVGGQTDHRGLAVWTVERSGAVCQSRPDRTHRSLTE